MTWAELFDDRAPIIGVVRLRPLPGSGGYKGELSELRRRAVRDAEALVEGGCDAVLLENRGDAPFGADRVGPETVAALTWVAAGVAGAIDRPLGLSVLRNDARAGVAVAAVIGAGFVRVNLHVGVVLTDQGLVEGRAAETLRLRGALHAEVALLANVTIEHAKPLGPLDPARAAYDSYYHGLVQALAVPGLGEEFEAARRAAPEAPLVIAGGQSRETVASALAAGAGVILDAELQPPGKPGKALDARLVREWTAAAGR
jgi:hypothetical protein